MIACPAGRRSTARHPDRPERGTGRALAGLWPDEDADELLAVHHAAEPEAQREEPALSYREVMMESTRRIAAPSNTDPDLIAPSPERIGVPFDELVP